MSRAPVRAKQAVCRGFPSLRPPVFPGGCPTGTEPGLKLPCFLELTSWCVGTLPLANQSVTTGSPTPVGRTHLRKARRYSPLSPPLRTLEPPAGGQSSRSQSRGRRLEPLEHSLWVSSTAWLVALLVPKDAALLEERSVVSSCIKTWFSWASSLSRGLAPEWAAGSPE